MASCYAMFKTLFRTGYPFSYNLGDLGSYYLAYQRLMGYWRELLPGRFLDLDYESLVEDPEGTTRRLLAYCGLEWREACLQFHDNPAPTAIASAAQVRRPIYRETARHGHFGRENDAFTWEKTDKAKALRAALGVAAFA